MSQQGEPLWEHQYGLMIGVIQRARRMMREFNDPLTTPSLMLIGPQQCGKTHFQEQMLPRWLDGRHGSMNIDGLMSRFNSQQIGSVLLVLSDAYKDNNVYQIRKDLGRFYKTIASNPSFSMERKGVDALSLPSKKLIVASANDETPEDLAAIPPVDGIEEKVIYLRCHRVEMWDDDSDPRFKEIEKVMTDEAEAFCHYVDNYKLPEECQGTRYDVAGWQHPETILAADQGAPSDQLIEEISKMIIAGRGVANSILNKKLSSSELWSAIADHSGVSSPQNLPRLAKSVNAFGSYMGHVRRRAETDDRIPFTVEKVNASTNRWIIRPRRE